MRGTFPAFSHFLAIRCPRALLVPATLAGLLTGLGTAPASAATCVSWSGIPAANSTGSAFAVGTTASGTQTLILHWNGTAWTQVPSPSQGTSDGLFGVGTTAAGSLWAVGSYALGGPSLALAVHCC